MIPAWAGIGSVHSLIVNSTRFAQMFDEILWSCLVLCKDFFCPKARDPCESEGQDKTHAIGNVITAGICEMGCLLEHRQEVLKIFGGVNVRNAYFANASLSALFLTALINRWHNKALLLATNE